jgi:hypothetical protein
MPSGRLAGLIALTVIVLIDVSSDKPGYQYPPTRLIPGERGTLALGLALSPVGTT